MTHRDSLCSSPASSPARTKQKLTFLSIKLTFLSIKLTVLSIKLTVLSIKLTFLDNPLSQRPPLVTTDTRPLVLYRWYCMTEQR